MPVEPGRLRRVLEHNDEVVEGVRAIGKRVQRLDPKRPEETSATAKAWVQSIWELHASLQQQNELYKVLRSSGQGKDEEQHESSADQQRFLLQRLAAEIRQLVGELPHLVELPLDPTGHRTWDSCLFDLENDLHQLTMAGSPDPGLLNVETIVALVNYRDRILSLILAGVLYQVAVLHWDLKSERAFADGPLVYMTEQVVQSVARGEGLPCKYRLSQAEGLPSAPMEPGPFSYEAKGASGVTGTQYRLLTVLREMQVLDAELRRLCGREGMEEEQEAAAAELRREAESWCARCLRLEQELSSRWEKGATDQEKEVEQLAARCSAKEKLNKKEITRIQQLDSDVQGWKCEVASLRREKAELAEKGAKMAKESLPVIERLLLKSRDAAERLAKDSSALAKTYRLQGEERRMAEAQGEESGSEVRRLREELAGVQRFVNGLDGELLQKGDLCKRATASQRSMHKACLEEERKIADVENRMSQRASDEQDAVKTLEGYDVEMREMRDSLGRARRRIAELRKQQEMCMQAYSEATGRAGSELLSNFHPVLTLPQLVRPDSSRGRLATSQ